MNFTFVAAALVFCSVATASVPGTTAEPAGSPPAAEAAGSALPRARARCTTCGVVEAIRRVEHGGGVPASFEFTVRLRDGSARTSHVASAGDWRNGDRIMLIGGAKATPVSKL